MNKSIKIIKQSRRTLPGETQQVPANTAKTENQVQREIAQTVTSWIEERRAVDGTTVKEQVPSRFMETTVGIVTALNPERGYEKATELAGETYTSGKGILEIIREKKIDPVKLTGIENNK